MTDKLSARHGLDVPSGVAAGTSGYDAFISYSHTLDGALAQALQTGLERFAKPWYRPWALRVFRDTTNLAANPNRWSSIDKALASSAWLVLMASPDAARSQWVDREVEWWRAHKSPQRLLVVLTEGEFTWAEDTEHEDAGHGDGATAALPPALRGAFVEEPRWVDLRWARDEDQVTQSNPRLREVVADVAAAVREVPQDVLVGEHIRQHRRTMWLARGGVTALAVLLITALMAAVGQRNQAVEAHHTVIKTVIGWDLRDSNPLRRLDQPFTGHAEPVISPDGRTLATVSADSSTTLWDLSDRGRPRRLGQPLTGHAEAVVSMAFSPDGRTLATGSADSSVILWDVTNRSQPRRLSQALPGPGWVVSVVFSPDGHTLASASGDRTIILWDLSDRGQPRRLGQPLAAFAGSVAFSPDGHTLAIPSEDRTVTLWDLSDRGQPRRLGQPLTGHADSVITVAFSPDRRTLASASADRAVILWDLSDRGQPRRLGQFLTGHTEAVGSVAFSPDGRTLATASWDTTVIVWDVTDRGQPRQLGQPLTGHTEAVDSVAFSPDGHTLVTASGDNTVILWDMTVLEDLRRDAVQEACLRADGPLDKATWDFSAPGVTYQDTCADR